ncbi:hypothetical protein PIB30_085132 [Stylosanthes scabra]|uniref:Uncharacterized protein n=1 Tax=Stylosanthes scabra TaxID=79078 RepID=A0ABU6VW01_9FABA|nr:hypothetical protein [Stylosanthes scabra]
MSIGSRLTNHLLVLSTFVERWRPESTVTLEDVAYQLRLPIDGQPVNGCLLYFEALMMDVLGDTAGVLLLLPGYTGIYAEHLAGTWFRWRAHYSSCRAGYFGNFLLSDRTDSTFYLCSRYLPTSDEKLLHTGGSWICLLTVRLDAVEVVVHPSIWHSDHRVLWTSIVPLIYFRAIEWHQVDRVIQSSKGRKTFPMLHLTLTSRIRKTATG